MITVDMSADDSSGNVVIWTRVLAVFSVVASRPNFFINLNSGKLGKGGSSKGLVTGIAII